MQIRAALVVQKPDYDKRVWLNFKKSLIEEAVEVCWERKGITRQKESRRLNKTVAAMVNV